MSAVPYPEVLEFLCSIGGRLEVELSESPELIDPKLYMQKAPSTATLTRVTLRAEVYEGEDEDEDPRELTDEELAQVAFTGEDLVLRGLGEPVRHRAPDGRRFTVRDVLTAVEETERQTRAASDWFGGIDVHHVFFEGIYLEGDDDVWTIYWGS